MRDIIHFAHGNGFPSPCYKQLLQCLETRYDCCYIDRIGHDSQYPVTDNWTFLVDELIANVRKNCSGPVIGIGHSLGGVLSFLAAIKEPSLFRVVIMLNAPLLNQVKSKVVMLAKTLGFIDRITPALRTLGRKQHWESREKLVQYLESRSFFNTFTENCLQDYITYGFNQNGGEYSLRFDKQIEYQIFRTIPHELCIGYDKPKVPVFLIYGDKGDLVDRYDLNYMKKQYNISSCKMKGTHMLPMEHPEDLAKKIFGLLDTVLRP